MPHAMLALPDMFHLLCLYATPSAFWALHAITVRCCDFVLLGSPTVKQRINMLSGVSCDNRDVEPSGVMPRDRT